jgi:stearoyl-CoA desaturase (delta-9 desaturase)
MCWITILLFFTFADLYWILIGLVSYIFYAGAGVALTFHRTLSHNSWKFPIPVRYFLILLASMANVGSALTWVAIHRAHHKYCDTPRDPHSPQHKSFWFMIFGSMFAKVSVRHVKDLLRDPFVLFVHKYYYLIQLPWIVLLYVIGGWYAVFACHVVPGGLTWLAGSFVNWYNHLYGYQRFESKDTSKNNALTGYLVMGEGWHNAHHAQPIRSSTSNAWYEFDAIYYIARALGGKPTIK